MPSEKARSLDHFYELLATGHHPKIELDFDVAADDFFKIATEFGDIGARITRVNERFIIKIKPPRHKHPARVVAADHRFVRIPLGHP